MLLTSGFRAQTPPAANTSDIATIRAREQEKVGHIYHLRGEAEIDYHDLVLQADTVDYNDDTGDVDARGHVALDGGPYDEHITADRATYNMNTETGKFYQVAGTAGYRVGSRHISLKTASPFAFSGKELDKVAEDRYVIYHGSVTSCELPHPKWTFSAAKIKVRLGDKAYLYNSLFNVKRVPVFYFPYTWHPAEKVPRQSGFLLPSFGTSSRKGLMLGDAFYWAINRSMDATLGAELWSTLGWAQHGQFRAKPSDDSYIQSNYFGVLERSAPKRVDRSGEDITLTAADVFPGNVRGVLAGEYLTSYAFRQTWSETFAQAINSEVSSAAFLSKNQNGFSFNLLASRYQNFETAQPGDSVVIQHLPTFDSSSVDQSLGGSRFFWSYDTSLGGISRSEPDFKTEGLAGRFDFQPRISYSLFSHGWTLRPELAPRETYYTEERVPGIGIGTTSRENVNRRAFEAGFELTPPALHRVYEKPVGKHRLKHTIEPHAIYRYVQGVDNFADIIRFDERDILADTNELELGVINRLYSKNISTDCKQKMEEPESTDQASADQPSLQPDQEAEAPPPATVSDCDRTPHEVVTWQLADKAFFNRDFGGALVPGRRNVFTSTADFTGIAFLTDPRRFSPVISRLHLSPGWGIDTSWDLDYDAKKGRIESSSSFLNYRLGDFNFSGGHTYLVTPGEVLASTPVPVPSVFNQYRLGVGYGNGTKRGLTAAMTVGFDVRTDFIQYVVTQSTYNWDCCGITAEFRRIALGPLRNENQIRFAFSLANVGNFGNLKKREALY